MTVKNYKNHKKKSPTAVLLLENGEIFWGYGIGAKKEAIGEICFNTSITGYQEIFTDPSYAKQIITFTFPHIGIVGTNENDQESITSFASGCVISSNINNPCASTRQGNRKMERKNKILYFIILLVLKHPDK